MMTTDQIRSVVANIAYPGFDFRVKQEGDRSYLQISCEDKCNQTGEHYVWSGRKWFLSQYMTRSELVNTALKATLTAVEHEAREKFTYKGVTIYDPHLDVDELVEFRQQKATATRAQEQSK